MWSVAFGPNGKQIASGSQNGATHVWNIDTGQKDQTFETKVKFTMAVAFSSNGKYIASGHDGGAIHVFDVITGKLVHRLEGRKHEFNSIQQEARSLIEYLLFFFKAIP
jgi:WD repeat-containing protein 61